ncbi:MAG: hypothetical protein U9O64_06910 [Campylobacterota bacterium]|nr:hypothetical protein [Campylobacterota bacterium]
MSKMILGIGSQSAGTLLLYNILDQCTEIAMHPTTELHYFDALYGARDKLSLQKFSQKQFNV